LDHPGLNNAFQINARTQISILYNDYAVLEQHHCSQTFVLLSNPECNILSTLNDDQYKLIRKYIIACILATDLSVHNDYVSRLKDKADKVQWDNFDDKKFIMCCLLKCADISNEVRPGYISAEWAGHVMAEFFIQVRYRQLHNLT
jgi:high affinity cGMP-specific 3',5'-cyclic phosphodiesterase 9